MRKIFKSRSGETIVEVIVSFVIVLMGIAAFTTAAAGALKLYDRAQALETANRAADEIFYTSRGSAPGGSDITLTFTRGGTQEFTCRVGQVGVGIPGGTRYYFYPAG